METRFEPSANHDGGSRILVPTRSPFSLEAVMRSHGWIRLVPFGEDEATGGFTYVTRLDSGRVVHLLMQETTGGVDVQTEPGLTPEARVDIADQVTWMLGLNQDLSDFYAQVRDEPKLAHVESQAKGRLLRCPTLFEDTVKTILTTNTSWAGTIRMVGALVAQFGEPWPEDGSRRAFPTPAQLAATDEATLRDEVRVGYRAPYILELARSVAEGDLDLESLKTSDLPTPALRKRLLAIKGVGAYAAANLLMLLGRYDFIPVDSWGVKMVSQEWYDGEPVGKEEVEAAFERWGAWKGLAYWFWNWSAG
jgi:3-methyladenine DNA glycosylase/8-oxoguanine DNA glycosylase